MPLWRGKPAATRFPQLLQPCRTVCEHEESGKRAVTRSPFPRHRAYDPTILLPFHADRAAPRAREPDPAAKVRTRTAPRSWNGACPVTWVAEVARAAHWNRIIG